jgi:hypothetical protein
VQVGWIAPPMSGHDLAEWEAFEQSFGPIVPHERIDIAQAMLSSVTAKVHGAKGDMRAVKFLPQWEGDRGQSADDLVKALRAMARKKEARD